MRWQFPESDQIPHSKNAERPPVNPLIPLPRVATRSDPTLRGARRSTPRPGFGWGWLKPSGADHLKPEFQKETAAQKGQSY